MSDRKYKQRGYRAGDAESRAPRPRDERPRPSPPPADRGERPRGRGLGAPTEDVFRCARCGALATIAAAAATTARCASCGTDLHTCTHCSHFDTGAPFECRLELAARVSPKDRANRCALFAPRLSREFAREKPKDDDPRSAFDALFKT
jgi:hypothetical protein